MVAQSNNTKSGASTLGSEAQAVDRLEPASANASVADPHQGPPDASPAEQGSSEGTAAAENFDAASPTSDADSDSSFRTALEASADARPQASQATGGGDNQPATENGALPEPDNADPVVVGAYEELLGRIFPPIPRTTSASRRNERRSRLTVRRARIARRNQLRLTEALRVQNDPALQRQIMENGLSDSREYQRIVPATATILRRAIHALRLPHDLRGSTLNAPSAILRRVQVAMLRNRGYLRILLRELGTMNVNMEAQEDGSRRSSGDDA